MTKSQLNSALHENEDIPDYEDDEDEIQHNGQTEIPVAVQEAFDKAFPHAEDISFGLDVNALGDAIYAIEFTQQDLEVEATYSANGELLKLEQEIELDELPASVNDSLMQVYPDAIYFKAEKIAGPDGLVSAYRVELEEDDVELEIQLDAEGKIINTGQDEEYA